MDIFNPYNGKLIETFKPTSQSEIDSIVQKLRDGHIQWQATPIEVRCQKIKKFRDLLEQSLDDSAAIQTEETGKPISQSIGEIRGTIERVDYFLDHAPSILTEAF